MNENNSKINNLKIWTLIRIRVNNYDKSYLTSSFPPLKVIYKYVNIQWDEWSYSQVKDVMFLLIQNILASRERLFRLNQCRDETAALYLCLQC